jgi:hypothetical protein
MEDDLKKILKLEDDLKENKMEDNLKKKFKKISKTRMTNTT